MSCKGAATWMGLCLSVLAAPVLPAPASGQSGSAEPVLLRLQPTVRSASLNGAATALVGDAGSVFANPAGLATIRRFAMEAWYRSMPSDQAFAASGAVGWRVGQFDVGLGARVFDLGSDPDAYLESAVSPDQAVMESMGVASLVYRFGMIAFGATGKYLRRTIGDSEQRAVSTDAGFAIAVFDIMALAFSVQNIRGNWYRDSDLRMPRLSRLGFTMNYMDPQESFRLMSVLEIQWPEGERARFIAGGEGGVVVAGVGVLARAGLTSRPPAAGLSSATYGVTLTFSRLNFDYAYRELDIRRQPAHQFGIRLRL